MFDRAAITGAHAVQSCPLPQLQPVLSTRAGRFRPTAVPLAGGPAGFAPHSPINGNPIAALQEQLRACFEPAATPDDPDSACQPADGDMAIQLEEAAAADSLRDADLLAQARAEAFAAGLAEGRNAAELEFGIRIATLDRLAARFAAARALEPAEAETALAQAAFHLVTAVLGDATELVRETLHARVHEAAESFAHALGSVELRLNAADFAALEGQVSWPAAFKLCADPSVPSGGFVLHSSETCVSDMIAERLQKLEIALRDSVRVGS